MRLLLILFLFTSLLANAQLELVGEYNNTARFIYIDDNESVIFLYNPSTQIIQLL